ncbi:alpha/beta fold hydrolase [Streptomyces sp. AcE210]|uniref:alpha/beta fold hydrolase n=1 Tax=Streptomyces sp. AcE210 TaxID=2292703 RepID=UPI000E306DE2|nr:alpha/beta fold hydrolase [Streptomyces sp. AcE210]RFC77715.1 alpha/beta fold hydrolase [Streptomyces sp. AcE210]
MAQPHLLHHVLDGPPSAPPLVLGPSLGTSLHVWGPQLATLARSHRVLRWDLPGHGGSCADLLPHDGTASVAALAAQVLRLADARGWESFAYAGISLGGAVGAHLAVHHPERVTSLGLVCSSAHFGPREPWQERAALVRREGVGPVVKTSPGRWFGDPGAAETPLGRALLRDLAATDPVGYAGCCDALAAYDLRPDLARITAPTLVVGGSLDLATPLDHARELADGIADATLQACAIGHLAVEQPEAVGTVLSAHLRAPKRPQH